MTFAISAQKEVRSGTRVPPGRRSKSRARIGESGRKWNLAAGRERDGGLREGREEEEEEEGESKSEYECRYVVLWADVYFGCVGRLRLSSIRCDADQRRLWLAPGWHLANSELLMYLLTFTWGSGTEHSGLQPGK